MMNIETASLADPDMSLLSTTSKRPGAGRRNNSTSTVQVRETMQAPDNEATIAAVAQRLHSYLEATRLRKMPLSEDSLVEGTKKLKINPTIGAKVVVPGTVVECKPSEAENSPPRRVVAQASDGLPSVSEVATFLYTIFSTAQCSVDCTIVCLIYLERFTKTSNLTLTAKNWRSLTATSMLLASKVWDDLSMVNADFATFLGYTLEQINGWEKSFLSGMKYDVRVSASQYAKYYFDLREQANETRDAVPMLDMHRAARLELLSSVVQKRVDEMRASTATRRIEMRRAVSDQHRPGETDLLPEAPVQQQHKSNVVLD